MLQSLPSADWEGGTYVNPSPAFCIPPSAMFATVYAYASCMLDILKPLLMRKHTVNKRTVTKGREKEIDLIPKNSFCFSLV